jgi:hypothetical protein
MRDGFLTAGTPLDNLLAEYELKYCLTSGRILCGPSYGLILETRETVKRLANPRVLDLFAGAGCISRVALQHGASMAMAVDIYLPEYILSANTGPFRARCERYELDCADLQLEEPVDVAVCDPFYELSLGQMSAILPRLAAACDWLIVNLGPTSHPRWCERVSGVVLQYFERDHETTHAMEKIGVYSRVGVRRR